MPAGKRAVLRWCRAAQRPMVPLAYPARSGAQAYTMDIEARYGEIRRVDVPLTRSSTTSGRGAGGGGGDGGGSGGGGAGCAQLSEKQRWGVAPGHLPRLSLPASAAP
jgi:uncharacterized membrane protein YgcG